MPEHEIGISSSMGALCSITAMAVLLRTADTCGCVASNRAMAVLLRTADTCGCSWAYDVNGVTTFSDNIMLKWSAPM